MSMNSPISKVRGLGSAKSGTEHWWVQKLLTVALVPLTIWFVASVVQMTQADYFTVRAWLSSPVSAILMLIYIVVGLYHLRLGVQSIVEDYINIEGLKIFLQFIILYGCTIIAVTCVFAILKIAL